MAVAAPVIVAEMAEWVKLGGGNSGIVGDPNHQYGFHLAANEVPASDYSRWRDPNGSDGPYVNWSYACAGDFRHGGRADLRALHATVLARLLRGEMPMVCEFIGQPWPDQPVLYWSRWGGLSRYTGAGHDLWSHISWYRSMADQRAHLWTAAPATTQEAETMHLVRSGAADGSIYLCLGYPARSGKLACEAVYGDQWKAYEAAVPTVQLPKGVSVAAAGRYDLSGDVTPWSPSAATIDYTKLAAEVAKVLPKPPTVDEIANELRDRLAG